MRAKTKITNHAKHVAKLAYQGLRQAVTKGAAYVMTVARNRIKRGDKPGPPGGPVRTKRGAFKKAIVFALETAEGDSTQRAVIGPSALFVGPVGKAHEFGGEFRGDQFPARPNMGPALQTALPRLPEPLKKLFG